MGQKEIGDILNMARQTVNRRMIAMDTNRPNESGPKIQPDTEDPTIPLSLSVDFSQHPDIFNDLIELAKKELRSPENQILYMFVKIHKTGMKTFNEKL